MLIFKLVLLRCNIRFCSPSFLADDYIAIGADCDELGAQIEEYILYVYYYLPLVNCD